MAPGGRGPQKSIQADHDHRMTDSSAVNLCLCGIVVQFLGFSLNWYQLKVADRCLAFDSLDFKELVSVC